MKKYHSVVSLGFNCYVAKDLERMGIREQSYPFDWVISNFSDVIRLIDNHFRDALISNNVQQDAEHENCYHDTGTGLDHYHDFFPQRGSVERQLEQVQKKYQRRYARFYRMGEKPTLYIRFIRNVQDYQWIESHFQEIEATIHKGNPLSTVWYVVLEDFAYQGALNPFVAKNLYHPILTSEQLEKNIRKVVAIPFWRIWKNKIRYLRKQVKKRISKSSR
ncbi:MAG: hypothetical protein J6K84_05695 [Oscillospiraceae bacterium]|nr:hypothetical protein [Oscillospiraceae bacterium]